MKINEDEIIFRWLEIRKEYLLKLVKLDSNVAMKFIPGIDY